MPRKTYEDQKLYDINSRFKEAFEFLSQNVRRKELAKDLGYNTTRQLYNIFEGNSLVPMVAIYYLSNKYGINLDWLFHGKNEMLSVSEESVDDLKFEIKELKKSLQLSKTRLIMTETMANMERAMNRLNPNNNSKISKEDKELIDKVLLENILPSFKG